MCKWLEVRPICPTCLSIRAHRDVGDGGDPLIKDPCQVTLCDTALRMQKICNKDQEDQDAPGHINILSSILCKFCKDNNADRLMETNITFEGNAEFLRLHDKLATNPTYLSERPLQRVGNQGSLLRLLRESLLAKEQRLRIAPLKVPRKRTATRAPDKPEADRAFLYLRHIWNKSMIETDVDRMDELEAGSPYTMESYRNAFLAGEQRLGDDVRRFADRIRQRVWGDPALNYDARLITIACLLIASGAMDSNRTFDEFARLTRAMRHHLREVVNVIYSIAPRNVLETLRPAPDPKGVQPVIPRDNPHGLSDSGSSRSSRPTAGHRSSRVSPSAHEYDHVEHLGSGVQSPQFTGEMYRKSSSPDYQPRSSSNDRERPNGPTSAERAAVSRPTQASPDHPLADIEGPRYDGLGQTSPAELRAQRRLQAHTNTRGHAGVRHLDGGLNDTIVVNQDTSSEQSDSDKENRCHQEVEHTDEDDSEENQDEEEQDHQDETGLEHTDESNGEAASDDGAVHEDLDGDSDNGEADDDAGATNVADQDEDDEEEEDNELDQAVNQTPTPTPIVPRRAGLRSNTQRPGQGKGSKRALESDDDDSEDDYKPDVKKAKPAGRTRSGTAPASQGATAPRSRGRGRGRGSRG